MSRYKFLRSIGETERAEKEKLFVARLAYKQINKAIRECEIAYGAFPLWNGRIVVDDTVFYESQLEDQ